MQKKNAGFSYVEVLAASALFVIVLMGVLALTLGARQNLSFARDSQRLGFSANSLSLAVRDLLLGGEQVTGERIENLARGFGIENYSVFIFGSDNGLLNSFHSSGDGEDIVLAGFGGLAGRSDSRLVYVVVMNEHGVQVGRAVNVAINIGGSSVVWGRLGG